VREQRQLPRPGSQEGVILFTVGGFKFAIAASSVKEIRGTVGLHEIKLEGMAPQMEKLRFVLEREGATYFVVDARRYFHLSQSAPGRVLILSGSPAALLVDSTDRMMDISALHALPRAFTQEERSWYRGLALVEGQVVPVVNPDSLLSKGEQEVLRAGLDRSRGVPAV
jgi:chemotaxis signal transduction protein